MSEVQQNVSSWYVGLLLLISFDDAFSYHLPLLLSLQNMKAINHLLCSKMQVNLRGTLCCRTFSSPLWFNVLTLRGRLTDSWEARTFYSFFSFSFYPHFILTARENGKNANEWMPSLICVAPEHNLLTWQAPGTSGIAAPKQKETSATLQAVACNLLVGLREASGQESLIPLQNGGAWTHCGADQLLLT